MLGKSSLLAMEKKYQAIKLYANRSIFLDNTALFRTLAVVMKHPYSNPGDLKDVMRLKGNIETLEKLAMTRGKAAAIFTEKRLAPAMRLLSHNTNEEAADFLIPGKRALPHKWQRYGSLNRKKGTPRAEPRFGSSQGKIGKTRYIGFKKVNKDFEKMIRSIANLIKLGDRKVRVPKMSLKTMIADKIGD